MESITWEDKDGARWIELEGDLDHETCEDMRASLQGAVDGGEDDVVFVMEGVTFLGSMGIGVILDINKQLKEAGRMLRLKGLRPSIRTVLDSMNLFDVLREVED